MPVKVPDEGIYLLGIEHMLVRIPHGSTDHIVVNCFQSPEHLGGRQPFSDVVEVISQEGNAHGFLPLVLAAQATEDLSIGLLTPFTFARTYVFEKAQVWDNFVQDNMKPEIL